MTWQLKQHANHPYESLKMIELGDDCSLSQRSKPQDSLYPKKRSRKNDQDWTGTSWF